MKYYELLYVIQPNIPEEELKKFIEDVGERIKSYGGEVLKNELWQKRTLAYPIKKFKQGYYVLVHYRSGPSVPRKIEEFLRIKEPILRWLNTNMLKKDIKSYEAKSQENGESK